MTTPEERSSLGPVQKVLTSAGECSDPVASVSIVGQGILSKVMSTDPKFNAELSKVAIRLESEGRSQDVVGTLNSMMRDFPEVQKIIDSERSGLSQELDALTRATELSNQWKARQPFALDKNDATRLHKLLQTLSKEPNRKNVSLTGESFDSLADAQVFVVRHNWLGVLGEQLTLDSEVRLPYPNCVFEFVCNGLPCLIWCRQPSSSLFEFLTFLNVEKDTWTFLGKNAAPFGGVVAYLLKQVLALAIVLDADVATTRKVDAPAKLNKKRALSGKPPLVSYHVVDLNKKKRRTIVNDGQGGTHSSPRLHLRRGHTRTYKTGQTIWINWMLVGDPDLGFVDKHYLL